jgi:dUTPase
MQLPTITVTEVNELSSSERGDGGFGSTGKWNILI